MKDLIVIRKYISTKDQKVKKSYTYKRCVLILKIMILSSSSNYLTPCVCFHDDL